MNTLVKHPFLWPYKFWTILLMILSVVPFFLIAFYSRPCVDDFNYSQATHDLILSGDYNLFSLIFEAIKTSAHFYHYWQGLYTSAFILSLQPAIWGESFYFSGVFFLLFFMFFSLKFFVKTLFLYYNIQESHWFYTVFTFIFILQTLPSICQGLYWFNGAWNYIPFFFLVLMNLSFILKFLHFSKIRYIFYSCFCSVLISGGNHITAFLNILCLSTLCLLCQKRKKLFYPLLVAIGGFLIVYFAPGTTIRQSFFIQPSLFETLYFCIKNVPIYFFSFCSFGGFLFILNLVPITFSFTPKINFSLFWITFFSGLIFCGIFCVPYYAMGSLGALRIKNIFYLTFLFLSVLNILCYLKKYIS